MTPRDALRILGEELRRRPYLIGFLIVLGGLTLWAVIPSPNRAIKQVIERGEKACEARDIERLEPILAKDFKSPWAPDRETTLEYFRETFDMLVSIEIRIKKRRISVKGKLASAEITFHVEGAFNTKEAGQIPFRGLQGDTNALERCEMNFVKEDDGNWRVSGVRLLGPPQ